MTDVIEAGDVDVLVAAAAARESGGMNHDDHAIEAIGLRCSYGDFEAVKGIDLAVRPGELFALLGTNGAGKTTTMETLEGHRRASGGQVSVLGLDPGSDRSRLRRRVGIMLQESGFAGDLTVRETVELWARLTTDPSPTDAALERLELTDRADTRVVQLSGGQKRRLDLVLATLNRPEVLFLDEPTAGLDPESRARTWEVIRDLRASGTTVVLTTHYLEEAEQLADQIAIMHEGRIATRGTLADVVGDAPAAISFRLTDLDGPRTERELSTVVAPNALRIDGDAVHLDVDDLQVGLGRLLAWAEDHDHRLDRLNAREASLDEVFSRISTARMEDAA